MGTNRGCASYTANLLSCFTTGCVCEYPCVCVCVRACVHLSPCNSPPPLKSSTRRPGKVSSSAAETGGKQNDLKRQLIPKNVGYLFQLFLGAFALQVRSGALNA